MWRFAMLVVAVAASSGCGVDNLGVRSVTFDLRATTVLEPPADLDAGILAALGAATGTMTVDVLDDDGHLMIRGAPALPDGFSYMAMAQFAEHARDDIPGGDDTSETGHGHGAVVSADTDSPLSSGDLMTINLGELEVGAMAGEWEREFTSSDVATVEMGAIRSAMVMVIPATGPAVAVMMGEVGEDVATEPEGEGGGHDHGP